MTNQQKQSKTNYILRLDHQFPFEQFGKKWMMYLPGFEGLYAISEDCCICALDRICLSSDGRHIKYKAKLLKQSGRRLSESKVLSHLTYTVSKAGKYTSFNKTNLFNFLSCCTIKHITQQSFNDTFPFKLLDKLWIGYLKDQNEAEFKNYLISDDACILKINIYLDTGFNYKHKIKKWSPINGNEVTTIKLLNGSIWNVYRTVVVKQVFKILKGMSDD